MRLCSILSLALLSAASAAQDAEAARKRIEQLASDLGHERPDVRDRATRELVEIGKPALEAMNKLAESGEDAEIRARAAGVARAIEAALRPKVVATVLMAKKKQDPADAWKGEEWIRRPAADLGYEGLSLLAAASEVSEERRILYPETAPQKPGGLYIRGQIVERTSDKATIEVSCSIPSMKSGRFTLDARETRRLIRLTESAAGGDLLLALELRFPSTSPATPPKRAAGSD
jgi:hypothetical protein